MSLPRTLTTLLGELLGETVPKDRSRDHSAEASKNAPLDVVAIHAEYSDFVLRSLKQLGGRPADIADLQQQVFIAVHRKLQSFDRTKPMKPWLYAICCNVVGSSRQKAHREIIVEDAFRRSIPDGGTADPEKHSIEKEGRLEVQALLDELDTDKRVVLVMYEIEDMSTREIAQVLGISERTVHSRLASARGALSQLINRRQAIALRDMSPPADVPKKTPDEGPDLEQTDPELPRWAEADGGATREIRELFQSAEPSRLMSESELAQSTARVGQIEEEQLKYRIDGVARELGLTPRETKIVHLLVAGFSFTEIGDQLKVHVATVRTCVIHIYTKTGVECRSDLLKCILAETRAEPTRAAASHGTTAVLSPRQREIASLLSSTGLSYKQVAEMLEISDGTLRKHVENIYRKAGVHSRAELAKLIVASKMN